MKHSLQLKLSQHLTLTPQLQQSIRLLQLSTLELNQELDRFLMENPLLERIDLGADGDAASGPGVSADAYRDAAPAEIAPAETTAAEGWEQPEMAANQIGSLEDGAAYTWREDGEEREGPQIPADSPSLQQHLIGQLNLTQMSDRDKQMVVLLIAHLSEDGYLVTSLDELYESLSEEFELEPEELQIALKQLQNLDPAGVGARDLSECLTLQLKSLPAHTPARGCALSIVGDFIELLATRDFNKLRKVLACDDRALKSAQSLIVSLNPKPGSAFAQVDTRYVVPDVIVRKLRGRWTANLNREAMPKLRINRMYADILQNRRDAAQMTGQLQEARWLIKNVQQRFDTILRVTQAIVERQKHFFEHGEVAMRPLVLREIAETVNLHESTVSRVTTQKYMLTSRGIYELKYFFGSHVATETGGACSATAIRALIKQLVSAEDTKKPLSDSRISDLLAQQGIVVARRTIAKYRDVMQIQPANLRKCL